MFIFKLFGMSLLKGIVSRLASPTPKKPKKIFKIASAVLGIGGGAIGADMADPSLLTDVQAVIAEVTTLVAAITALIAKMQVEKK